VIPNFSMITQNCDDHPLLNQMHKPDKDLPPGVPQDKRAVVPIEPADWDKWLTGTVADAEGLIRVPDLSLFRHCAADPAKQVPLVTAALM
jgi:hypothetical protein